MVVGVMLCGVMSGLLAASMALFVGHAPLSVGLAYCLAGMFGSSIFVVTALLRQGFLPQGR